jgi:catalase
MVGCLVTDDSDAALVASLRAAVEAAGAKFVVIAPKAGGASLGRGKKLAADFALNAAPSVFFEAVLLAPSEAGVTALATEGAALDVLRDAFGHLKVIGYAGPAIPLLQVAGLDLETEDRGLVSLEGRGGIAAFVKEAKAGKVWEREPKVRTVY